MNKYSVYEILRIICGELIGSENLLDYSIQNIAIDSRTIVSGNKTLFFALVSDRNNGHKYIPEVLKKGVKVVVVSEQPKHTVSADIVYIYVNDTLIALQRLAAHNRKINDYPVIGITGSNGKTIIKEWLYDLLKETYSIARSPKSYNSQIGVALSAWLMEPKHNLAILEAGISMPGEMGKLQPIVDPTIGVFSNIGMAHQENFSDLKQKLEEKLLLFKNTKILVFSADQGEASEFIKDYCQINGIKALSWSAKGNEASIHYIYTCKKEDSIFQVSYKNEEYSFSIPFTDSSAVENASHCFATCVALGTETKSIQSKMNELASVAMRLEIKQGNNNCILINDFYNSDINSFSIALNVLENQAKKGHLRKTIVLSDIEQSGTKSSELYTRLSRMVSEVIIDEFIGIGKDLFDNQKLFDVPSRFYRSTDEFLNEIKENEFTESVILLKGARKFSFEHIASKLQQKTHQTILEISLDAMVENLNMFRAKLESTTKIMAMVKAFSYGSGTTEIANLLQFHKVDYLAVAVADEGIELRKSGITIPIVVMNPESQSFQNIIDFHLEPNIYSLQLLSEFISHLKINAVFDFPVHIKIDTGMNRLGFKKKSEIEAVLSLLKGSNLIHVNSIFSHLSASDDSQMDDFTLEQIYRFKELAQIIHNAFDYKIDLHILNSAGIERFPEHQFDMARLGIGLYGVSCTGMPLSTISSLKTTISQIKRVGNNETIGYSRNGKLAKDGKIAIIPIGYADGLRRVLGNGIGRAFINDKFVPIIGNICMDMCMLDVTNVDVQEGDEVEIFGKNISVNELAEKSNTIPYEILTGISQRVKRVYVQE